MDQSAELLERLLTDADFRAAFRAQPDEALRGAGMSELADRVRGAPSHKALETLEIRESRSSLAGAMMAGVLEGIGLAVPTSAAAAQPAPQAGPSNLGDVVESAQRPAGPSNPVTPTDVLDDQATADNDEPDDSDSEDDEGDENEPDEDENENDESDDEGSDDDQDAPGEGSSGEDANDSASDGDSSDSDDSDDGDDSDSSDSNDDGSGSDDGDTSPGEATPLDQLDATDYPGDDASQVELARWMGAAAQARGVPPELPVMAALTESGMQNLSGGDRDSVGFFQMRLGLWNRDEYAGYPNEPERQLDWFLDQAATVGAQRRARGLALDDPSKYGDWIADIEQPAAQYRGRYQLHYDEAHQLLENAQGQQGGKGNGQGSDDLLDTAASAADLHPGPKAAAALEVARKYLGTPYKWGGSSPSTGFDCSGLVQWAYAKVGIRLPRVTDQQILTPGATKVDRDSLLPGDLVFFRDSTGYVHHVGISLGGDKFISSPHTGDVVKVSSLSEPYWSHEFTGGRRFDSPLRVDEQGGVSAHAAQIDPRAVRMAQEALAKDAEEVARPDTILHRALVRQELGKADAVQFLPAVTR